MTTSVSNNLFTQTWGNKNLESKPQSINKDELSWHVSLINPYWHEYIADWFWWPMRERVLGVQAGLTSVANEVVVLVMGRGAGSMAARGLRRLAGSSSWLGTTSTDPHQPSLGWPDVCSHASNRVLITVVMQGAVGWRRAALRRGESGENERSDWWRRWGECECCGSV
jgi:hypothetical protein